MVVIRGQLDDIPGARRTGDQFQTRVFAVDELVVRSGGCAAFPFAASPLGGTFPLRAAPAASGGRFGRFLGSAAARLTARFAASFTPFGVSGGRGISGDSELGRLGEGVVCFQDGGVPLVGGLKPLRLNIVDGIPLADLLEPPREIFDRDDFDIVNVDTVKIRDRLGLFARVHRREFRRESFNQVDVVGEEPFGNFQKGVERLDQLNPCHTSFDVRCEGLADHVHFFELFDFVLDALVDPFRFGMNPFGGIDRRGELRVAHSRQRRCRTDELDRERQEQKRRRGECPRLFTVDQTVAHHFGWNQVDVERSLVQQLERQSVGDGKRRDVFAKLGAVEDFGALKPVVRCRQNHFHVQGFCQKVPQSGELHRVAHRVDAANLGVAVQVVVILNRTFDFGLHFGKDGAHGDDDRAHVGALRRVPLDMLGIRKGEFERLGQRFGEGVSADRNVAQPDRRAVGDHHLRGVGPHIQDQVVLVRAGSFGSVGAGRVRPVKVVYIAVVERNRRPLDGVDINVVFGIACDCLIGKLFFHRVHEDVRVKEN